MAWYNFIANRRAKLERQKKIADKIKEVENPLRTLEKDVENDKIGLKRALTVPENLQGYERSLEEKRTDVLARAMLLVGAGNMQITPMGGGGTRSASENQLPVSSYLAGHSGRILIQIPPSDKPDALFNWLTSGHPEINAASHTIRSCSASEAQGQVVTKRLAATHAIKVSKDGQSVEEVKTGLGRSFINMVKSYFTGKSKHFGMNIRGGSGETNIHGNPVTANGAHGHLYFHYEPPTNSKPGGLMIGLEGSEPGVSGELGDHSLVGAPDKLTAFGGRKWQTEKQLPGEVGDVAIQKKYNGLRIEMDDKKISEIVGMSDEAVRAAKAHLHEVTPATDLADLRAKIDRAATPTIAEPAKGADAPSHDLAKAHGHADTPLSREAAIVSALSESLPSTPSSDSSERIKPANCPHIHHASDKKSALGE